MMNDPLIKVRKVEPLGGHRLRLTFSDGAIGERDFSEIVSQPREMTAPLRDPTYFARVFLEFGAPTWPNGYDMAPHALYDELAQLGALRHPVVSR
jgi:Protein of unknown function (DUF2442)